MDDYTSLPYDDLQDEYGKLLERYKELRQISESDAQRIHELKRSLDTANATEAYLCQELEALSQNNSQSVVSSKVENELEELRRSHSKLKAEHTALQEENESLMEENERCRSELKVAEAQNKREEPSPDFSTLTSEHADRLNTVEHENVELLQKLEELCENEVRSTMAIAEREKKVEILRDHVNCLEENLRSKRDELEEKTQLLESAQEQLADANAKIAMLMTAPENNERKGNSLFAEVDDQRQAMKQLLAAQKKSYMQMKKIFNESEYEIRRLKRENIAMHTELQACSSIFCNADKTYQEKLNERIRQLYNQNEDLERKLKWTQERLNELAEGKGVLWLDSMFNFCKQETNDLKQQLHSVRIQKASLEEQLRNAKQEMVRWRFESLKSRCILIDRENLLTENKILFKPVAALEFNITDEQSRTARPRIVHIHATATLTPTPTKNERVPRAQHTYIEECEEKTILEPPVSIKSEPSCELNENVEDRQQCQLIELKDIQIQSSQLMEDREVKFPTNNQQPPTTPARCFKFETLCLITENKENEHRLEKQTKTGIKPFKSPLEDVAHYNDAGDISLNEKSVASQKSREQKMSPPPSGTLPGPSILCKQRDIFAIEVKPNVKFSAKEPTVHNLSAVSLPPEGNEEQAGITNKNKATVQNIRTKSSIVVRRLVVGAKLEPH